MTPALEWSGPTGAARSGEWSRPREQPDSVPAVLVVGAAAYMAGFARELIECLTRADCCALWLDAAHVLAQRSDREACAELEAALAVLAGQPGVDARALALVGLADAGTLAFLCACTSRRVAAVVDVCGALVLSDLDARRPVQPLDLALNLSAPLLIVHAALDATPSPEAVRQAVTRLERALRDVQVCLQPGRADDFLREGSGGYHREHAARAGEVIVDFLRASFAAR